MLQLHPMFGWERLRSLSDSHFSLLSFPSSFSISNLEQLINWCKFSFYFAQKKLLFFILHIHFYKTPISVYLFYTFIQWNIHSFTIFYYSPSPPLSLIDQQSLTDSDPTLSHRPRPNTQRKVAIVFVGVRFRRSGDQNDSLLGSVFLCSS